MELFNTIVETVNAYPWGISTTALLFETHLYPTIRTGFIQRKTPIGIRLPVTGDPDSGGDTSQFVALTTALAPTIGTGSIIGVETVIALGGLGVVL